MTGVSGTGRAGTLHHYYVCQKRRNEHSCQKEHVRRDDIETAVARAIVDNALNPDSIEWIADNALAYMKKLQEGEQLAYLQARLSDTQKAIKNIMSAIEKGILTDTTKDRLLELEAEQKDITAQIKLEESNIMSMSRKDIVLALSSYQNGDVRDKSYISKLFDAFLIAVYLYDDEMKIVFTFSDSDKRKTTKIPLDVSKLDTEESTLWEAVRISSPKPHHTLSQQ